MKFNWGLFSSRSAVVSWNNSLTKGLIAWRLLAKLVISTFLLFVWGLLISIIILLIAKVVLLITLFLLSIVVADSPRFFYFLSISSKNIRRLLKLIILFSFLFVSISELTSLVHVMLLKSRDLLFSFIETSSNAKVALTAWRIVNLDWSSIITLFLRRVIEIIMVIVSLCFSVLLSVRRLACRSTCKSQVLRWNLTVVAIIRALLIRRLVSLNLLLVRGLGRLIVLPSNTKLTIATWKRKINVNLNWVKVPGALWILTLVLFPSV